VRKDPESKKKTVQLSVFFALSESARTKAALRTLVKLTPGHIISEKKIWSQFHQHADPRLLIKYFLALNFFLS